MRRKQKSTRIVKKKTRDKQFIIATVLTITVLLLLAFLQLTGFSTYDTAGYGVADVNQNLPSCQDLTQSGVYTINQSLSASGNCILVNVSNVVIEGGGFSITGNGSGYGLSTLGGYDNITIKNVANISNFSTAILLQGGSVNSTIQNVTSTGTINISSSSNGTVIANSTIIVTNFGGIVDGSPDGGTTGSSGLRIISNTITGSVGNGIIFSNACNSCTFESNSITHTSGAEGTVFGLSVWGTGMNITSNNINVSNGTYYPASIETSNNLRFMNNIIETAGRGGVSIDAWGTGQNISYNTVLSNSTVSNPLPIFAMLSGGSFEWNNITKTGSASAGSSLVRLAPTSSLTALSNKIVSTNPGWGGILIDSNSGSVNVTRTNVTVENASAVDVKGGAGTHSFSSNNFITTGTGGSGMNITTNSHTIVSNTISTNGKNAQGIRITSSHNKVQSNTITTVLNDSDGIRIDGGAPASTTAVNNSFFSNNINTIGNSSPAMNIVGGKNNKFESDLYNTSIWNSYGINMGNGRNETFKNVQIITPSSNDITLTKESLYIINSSFSESNVTVLNSAGNLYIQWYVYVNVTNGTTALPSINVSGFRNTNFALQDSQISNSSGWATLTLTETNKSSGSTLNYVPHTINATGELVGNYPNSSTVNFTATNSTTVHLVLAEDLSSPNVSFNAPASSSYGSAILINATVLDDLRVANVSFRHENGSVNSSWFGMTKSGTNWTGTLNLSQVSDGNYTIRINAIDTGSNENSTVTRAGVYVDTTPPGNIMFNTPVNGSFLSQTSFVVNVSFSEMSPDACVAEIGGTNYSMVQGGTTCSVNMTSQAEGMYLIRVFVNDTVGLNGTSGTVNVTLDTTSPAVSMTSPANSSHHAATVSSNFTASATDAYLNNVTIFIDGVANETNSSGVNGSYIFSKRLSDGNHTWRILSYDRAGNSNQSVLYNISTETDITPPIVAILFPTSGMPATSDFVVNATVTDVFTVSSVQYRYENLTTNNSWISMIQSGTNWSATFNSSQSGDGNYTIRINATDNSGNNNTIVTIAGVVIDRINPSATLNLPPENQLTNIPTINLSVNVTDTSVNNVTIYINGVVNETNSSGGSGTYRFTKLLSDGNHTWSVIVKDYVGNSNQTNNRSFSIDTLVPSVSISTTSGIKARNFPLNSTVTDAGSVMSVLYRTETLSANNSWMVLSQSGSVWSSTFNGTSVADGNYTIRVNATDAANNSNTSQTIIVTYDTTPPSISSTIVSATNGTSGTVFSVNATIADETTFVNSTTAFVTITKNATVIPLTLSKSGAVYTASWNSSGRPNGSYVISFEANDSVGNTRVVSGRHVIALSNSSLGTYQNSSYTLTEGSGTLFNNSLNGSRSVFAALYPARSIQNASLSIITYESNQEGGTPDGKRSLGKFFHIAVDNDTNTNLSSARINVTYTASEVTDANIQESSLRLYKWNPASSSWTVLGSTGVISGSGIVWGNVSSFSSFGVFGDPVSSGGDSGDSGGSSGGGGGGGGGSSGGASQQQSQQQSQQESQQQQQQVQQQAQQIILGSPTLEGSSEVTTISRGGGGSSVIDSTSGSGGGLACTAVTTTQKQTIRVGNASFNESMLPKGYKVIKEPFSLECSGGVLDITLTVPGEYKNLTVLRCSKGVCAPTVEQDVERTVLTCGGVETSVIGEKIIGKKELTIPTLSPVPSAEKKITVNDRTLSSGKYSVKFNGIAEFTASLKEASPAPTLGAKASAFLAPPVILHAGNSESTTAKVEFNYTLPEGLLEESIAVYTYDNEQWKQVTGTVNKEENTVTAELSVDGNAQQDKIIAVLGTLCSNCLSTKMTEVYSGSAENALVLVHGVFATSENFESLVAEFSILKQPWTIYTYEYPYNDPLEKNGEELAGHIQRIIPKHKRVYIVGHSMGGLVSQEAILRLSQRVDTTTMSTIKKAILIASPNTGAPARELYKLLDTAVVNQLINASKFYLTNETLDVLSTGKNIQRVQGVTYEVVAGTTGYNFTTEYFKDEKGNILPNDGIVTTTSAQLVGGRPVNNLCADYYEVGLTHTELNDHSIINRIIARSINEHLESEGVILAGYNQYYNLHIPECSPEDKYLLVGKQITKAEAFQPLQCGCGNGVCGIDETAASCPSDCAGFKANNLFGGAVGIGVVGGGIIALLFLIIAAPLLYYLGRKMGKKNN